MRRFRVLTAILFVLLAPLSLAYGAETVNSILKKLYASPLEAKGEIDLHVAELEALFKENIRSPAAPVIMHRLLALLPDCTDPTILDDFYADLARLGKEKGLPSGLLASDAAVQHRANLLRQGKFEEADKVGAFDSFAKKILAIGPFGFNASSLHDAVFPPEKHLETLQPMDGYAGPVDWIEIERNPRKSGFNLNKHIYPREGAVYALYPFRMAQARGILLTFFTDASAKVWFNGELVGDIDRRKADLPGIFKWALPAAKGWNRILIKLSAGKPSFSMKITDRTGYPLNDLVEIKEKILEPLAPDAQGREEKVDLSGVDMLTFLISHAQLHPDNVHATMALAYVLASKGLYSRAIHEGERAVSLEPENAHALHLLGRLYQEAEHLPQNFRTNRAVALFKQALAVDPDFYPARLAVALNDHQNDRSEEAIRSLTGLLDESPRVYTAWLALISIYDRLDWKKELLCAIKEARKMAPRDTRPLVHLAHYYQSILRNDLALDSYQKALDLDAAGLDLIEQVAGYRWERDEQVEAFGLYERILALADTTFNKERMAGLHFALGDPVKTEEIYAQLNADHPKNPKYYAMLGDLAFDSEGTSAAAAWYEKTLKLSPEQHVLREILSDWKVSKDSLFQDYAVEEAAYLENLPDKSEYPKASAICSLDQTITRVYADGSSKSEVHQIFKILDKDAVENLGRMPVGGRIHTLKVIQPDGKVLEPVNAENRGVFNMPGLDVGSILVVRYTILTDSSVGGPLSLGRFFFQDVQGTMPFLFSRYVVAVPDSLDLHIERKIPQSYEEERLEGEGESIYLFTARKVPVAVAENRMPPEEEAFPNVRIYQSGNWIETSQRIANSFFPNAKPTEELRLKAAEVVAEAGTDGEAAGTDEETAADEEAVIGGEAATDLEKAKALYAFVNDHVREDRGHQDATSILIEGQGSRGTLFVALLDAAGLKYDLLRCGVRPGYLAMPADWTDVSPALLPNTLVRLLPEGDEPVLLSFNSRLTPFGEIPPYLFSAPAMKVTGKPERIETLPGGDPIGWLEEEVNLNIKINFLDGLINGTLSLPGFGRTTFREQIQRMDAHSRQMLFEYRVLRGIYPGAQIKKFEILGIENDEVPPTFSFTLEAKDFIHPVADKEGFKVMPAPMNLTMGFIRKTERLFPMIQRGYATFRYIMDVDLNDEYKVYSLPDSLVDRRFFLNYSLVVSETDRGVRIERTIDFLPADVTPERYGDLIEMMKKIDAVEIEPIVLQRTAAAPKSEPAPKPEAKEVKDDTQVKEGSEKADANAKAPEDKEQ